MNPLYQQLSNKNMGNLIQQFKQFKQMFTGDPQQQVQQLLNSGRVTQAQYDKAVQMAQTLQQMMK